MIYAIRCLDRIKIGFSEAPELRFNKVAADAPFPCELVGAIEGDRTVEAELHTRFGQYRVYREWFFAVGEIIDHFAPPAAENDDISADDHLAQSMCRLSEQFREARIASGKSFAEIGREMQVAPTTVMRWERMGEPRSGSTRQMMLRFIDQCQSGQAAAE